MLRLNRDPVLLFANDGVPGPRERIPSYNSDEACCGRGGPTVTYHCKVVIASEHIDSPPCFPDASDFDVQLW